MPSQMERFTERARRTLSFAQVAATEKEHSYIGPEHLLVGLMREDDGIGARVLRDLGLDQQRVEELVTKMTRASDRGSDAHLELSSDTKKVLELAVDEARRLGHHYIGTEHLLLGLSRLSEGVAIDVLKRLTVSPEEIRRQTRRVLQETPPFQMPPVPDVRAAAGRTPAPADWRIWLTMAEGEARRLEHNYVGTAHLLIALLSYPQWFEAIRSLGIEKDNVINALKDMEYSPQLITSLGLAVQAAYLSEKGFHLRLEFLLLGLVRNKQGVAAQIIEKLGASLEEVEKTARDLLAQD